MNDHFLSVLSGLETNTPEEAAVLEGAIDIVIAAMQLRKDIDLVHTPRVTKAKARYDKTLAEVVTEIKEEHDGRPKEVKA